MSTRDAYRALAEENLAIFEAGFYLTAAGQKVDLTVALLTAEAGTEVIGPEARPWTPSGDGIGSITVADEDTLGGAARLRGEGRDDIAVLNFASARSPGGGFLRGGNAQEEALCRATTLYAALARQSDFYADNRAWPNEIYADRLLYTPNVAVIRDPYGYLRPDPPSLAMITAPAPNAKAVSARPDAKALSAEVDAALERRAEMILRTAARYGHRALVLGAWGCGVFGNPPARVAEIFQTALTGTFKSAFDRVHFAILGDADNLSAFEAGFSISR
ncbi:MAG: TIGR02452 family protein [Pseudomonadota bacterium]